ncbi:hypothetical protein BBO99_00006698 [Phytophthora kernoviae]|uniref:SKP1 component POZ domain-containing protein n=2 Tax=Phytophthora kernoviae TaxID=325452 RepID=A0A421GK90_9STRA|nr:hypothetical protein G195_003114 [Phytophthora kernoviae 00238/432]KAG2526047.1 hypothetical protein JM16_002510 [Phytophthora kernoviae]KAG2527711.1 hypothetical protein JM18_002318 [Phytophthora kernoviae]RLN10953.1 hypothetical protein BBI17_000750 [Phytophthora kernoviae]RLN77492.1 hypothetical protein BBO99_00006698 [Phytophthora kernoviae]
MRVNVGDEKRSKRKLPDAEAFMEALEAQEEAAKARLRHRSKLQLRCADDTTFDVSYEQAMMSSTLWVLMQGKKPRNGVKQHVIPIFDVPTESVERALDYCSCLYKQQVDRIDTAMHDWEEEFVSLESKELCDLAKVASNLDIQPLVDLTCRSIAQIMSATSEADELRKKFGLEDPPAVECSCELRKFEDDDDEDMAKVIKMFELNLESAYRDCDNKKKPRLEFVPREVFRSSLVSSSQFECVQRMSATMS